MRLPASNNRTFISAIVFTIIVTLVAFYIYSSLSKWHNTLVEKSKLVCDRYADKLHDSAKDDLLFLGDKGLLAKRDLSSAEIKLVDSTLKRLSKEQLLAQNGLEGGFYLSAPDEFYGYSFPTSPPPEPVYGPPPRSYNIIKNQSLQSIESKSSIIRLHSFNAAIFLLATKPVEYQTKVVGVVWVRIHIENDLPNIKLKEFLNATAFISILGFLALMLFSALLSGEIKGMKMELENIRNDAAFRLRKRRGIIGYIASTINAMLNTIEEENRQRQVLEQQLNQKEKLASLGNMIAGVAHEVKTPLAIIKTRIQMWQKEVHKNDKIAEHISPESMQIVIDEINRLSNLVKRLLIFSRPIQGKMKQCDLNRIVNEVVSFIAIEKNNHFLTIDCRLNPDIPMVPMDENSIKQVILNILENSLEAMEEKGTIKITTGLEEQNEKIILHISDSGKGIPNEMIHKIFDPFYTSKETGAGLGLAISYQIIKAHNGEISFSNNPEGGVACTIKLPVLQ